MTWYNNIPTGYFLSSDFFFLRILSLQIVLLLRLVPLLPFNMLNYLLSVTPVSLVEYMLASWLGMMVSSSPSRAIIYLGVILMINFYCALRFIGRLDLIEFLLAITLLLVGLETFESYLDYCSMLMLDTVAIAANNTGTCICWNNS